MRLSIQKMYGVVVVGVLLAGLVSCKMFDRAAHNPTAPAKGTDGANYAQMPGGSITVTVNGGVYQINLALSDQPSFPYGEWFYAELNEQTGVGKAPGVDQVAVNLSDVVFTFSGLPDAVTEIDAALKTAPRTSAEVGQAVPLSSCQNPGQNQDGSIKYCKFAVQNGSVAIPVAYADLIQFFDATHFSVWFKAEGGVNGQGPNCGSLLTVSGTLPDDQQVAIRKPVTIGKALCFGTNPFAPPAPACVPNGGGCTDNAQCCSWGSGGCCSGGTTCSDSFGC